MRTKTFRHLATAVAAVAVSVPAAALVASAADSGPGGGRTAVDGSNGDRHGDRLEKLLDEAVANNIITSDQADRIVELAAEKRSERQDGRRDGHGAGRAGRIEHVIGVVAEQTGLSEEDVRTRLDSGATVADIAGDQFDQVVATLIADAEQHFSDKVAAGELTREQADMMLTELKTELPARLAQTPRHDQRPHFDEQRDEPGTPDSEPAN